MKVRHAFAALSLAVVAHAAAQQDTQKGTGNDAPPIAGSGATKEALKQLPEFQYAKS